MLLFDELLHLYPNISFDQGCSLQALSIKQAPWNVLYFDRRVLKANKLQAALV